MIKRIALFFSFLLFYEVLCSQTGGKHAFEFLNLTNSSRALAMGGNLVTTLRNSDASLLLSNPTLISEKTHNKLALNYTDYFSDINFGFATYSRTFEKYGNFAASMQFINYGKFTEADETGVTYSDFTLNDYALTIGWSRFLKDTSFVIAANFKTIYSSLKYYFSFGLATDVAASYFFYDKNIATTLIIKNIGRQIKPYVKGVIQPLPFEIQAAINKKLEHVPLSFNILLHNLQTYDLTYNDPKAEKKIDLLTGKEIKPSKVEDIANKLMHHVIVGAEFSPSKLISFQLGYNYHRRQEMSVESKRSLVGFSFGIGINTNKFSINYARSKYHLAGSPNVITLSFGF